MSAAPLQTPSPPASPLPSPASPPLLELPLVGRIQDPWLAGLVLSLLILALAYLIARVLSSVLGRILMLRARRTATEQDEGLVRSLRRPLTTALFFFGAAASVAPLPLPEGWRLSLVRLIFAGGVTAATIALVRGWRLLLFWWAYDPRDGQEKEAARDLLPLFHKVGGVLIGVFGLATVLENVGIDVNSLIVSLGVGSLAVGLAAQDTLANMFAGFTLMLDRPFRIGERIQLASGEVGDVETIGIRATRIKTSDDTLLVVPNSVLTKDRVVNLSRPSRALTTRLDVGVAYGSDIPQVKQILREAALASSRVDPEREPVVTLTRFGDFSVSFRLVFWVRDYEEQGLALGEVHEEIYRRFAEAGIEIPFPVRRVIQEIREAGNGADEGGEGDEPAASDD
jgi:MscS family membrane protein